MASILTIARQRRQRRLKERNGGRQRAERLVLGSGFLVSAALVVLILAGALTYAALTQGLPSLDEMTLLLDPQNGTLLQPTRLYDRTGEHLLAVLAPQDGPRQYVPYDRLPHSLINATVAVSQPDFWTSPGFRLAGWRNAEVHLTLAQQLAYSLLLWDAPAGPVRAIHERMLAGQMTSIYGREKVLEWYLNSADYGHYAYGAEAASEFYFGKPVSQIDVGEAALLAAISAAPSLDPLGAPSAAEQGRTQVIRAMLEQGLITPAETSQAILQAPVVLTNSGGSAGKIAPAASAFVSFALSQLEPHFGAGRLERGGLTITTTLDYGLQAQSLCSLQVELGRLAGISPSALSPDGGSCEASRLLSNLPAGASKIPDASASMVMLDPQSGQVLVAVGDIRDGEQSQALARHAAGTTVTPFVYLTGFSRGFNPASLAWDIPTGSASPDQVYHGPVRLRTALANDYLPPALHLLGQLSQESVQNIAASFGLELPAEGRLLQDDFSVSPFSLAEAYGIFANGGVQAGQPAAGGGLAPAAILKVTGTDHSLWLDWNNAQARSVVSPQLAYLLNHVLSDETARWPTLGHPNPLEIGRPAGAKLSHSLDLSSAWAIGYTPQRTAVVWLGISNNQNPDPAGLAPVSFASADLWHAMMQYALHDLPSESWEMPAGISTASVCDPSGMLPTPQCPNVVSEIFLEGRQPVQADTLYRAVQVNIETGLLATVFTPPALIESRIFMDVPAEARDWAKTAGILTPPSAYDTIQQPAVLPDVHITLPEMFSDGRGQLEIHGTAAGADFASFRLEYGQGLYPREWTQIGSDSKSSVNEGLLGTWDTSGLDGLYALRLMVVRTDQRVDEAVVQVTLDNTSPQVAFIYPQEGQVVDRSQEPQVALQVQATDPFMAKVEFTLDGILIGQSLDAPYGILWKAVPGQHTLKAVATDRAGNSAEASLHFSVK